MENTTPPNPSGVLPIYLFRASLGQIRISTLLFKFAVDDRCSRLRQDTDVSDFKCNEENGALESAATS